MEVMERLTLPTFGQIADWLQGVTGNTPEKVREELSAKFGVCVRGMERSGFLLLWPSVEQYNAQAPAAGVIIGLASGYFDEKRVQHDPGGAGRRRVSA